MHGLWRPCPVRVLRLISFIYSSHVFCFSLGFGSPSWCVTGGLLSVLLVVFSGLDQGRAPLQFVFSSAVVTSSNSFGETCFCFLWLFVFKFSTLFINFKYESSLKTCYLNTLVLSRSRFKFFSMCATVITSPFLIFNIL